MTAPTTNETSAVQTGTDEAVAASDAQAVKQPSPENLAVASQGHYPVKDGEDIDWGCQLFDGDGYPHRLIALGSQEAVTKQSFAHAIWDRRTGKCKSHDDMYISNFPLSDAEKKKRLDAAFAGLQEMQDAPPVMRSSVVTVGVTREDGDISVLATLNNQDGHLSPGDFINLIYTVKSRYKAACPGVALFARQDAPDYVTPDESQTSDRDHPVPITPYTDPDHPVSPAITYTDADVTQVAKLFKEYLARDLLPAKYDEISRLNLAQADPSICHSHDFLDANVIMIEAFTDGMAIEPDVRSDTHMALWNAAWGQAKGQMKDEFQAKFVPPIQPASGSPAQPGNTLGLDSSPAP